MTNGSGASVEVRASARHVARPLVVAVIAYTAWNVLVRVALTEDVTYGIVFGAHGLVFGLGIALWVIWRLRSPLLRIDAEGLQFWNKRVCAWRDLGIVWIGQRGHGRRVHPTLTIWTRDAIATSQRTGFQTETHLRRDVPVTFEVDELAH